MSNGTRQRRVGRSIAAVIAGFAATAALSLGVDVVLHALRVFPPWGEAMSDSKFVIATSYRIVFTVLGGYVTARMSPYRPMARVWILGCIGVVVATVGVLATWNAGPQLGPHWYPIALVLTALPCVWLGGRLAVAVPSETTA